MTCEGERLRFKDIDIGTFLRGRALGTVYLKLGYERVFGFATNTVYQVPASWSSFEVLGTFQEIDETYAMPRILLL